MQGVRLIFGSDPKYIAVPEIFSSNIQFGFLNISAFRVVVLLITLGLVAALWFAFYRTRFGVQVRAVMQNKEMAASFGINSGRIYMLTFALGAGLAGIAGSLFGVLNIVLPTMGTSYVVQALPRGGGGRRRRSPAASPRAASPANCSRCSPISPTTPSPVSSSSC